jgi:hypothetical protein
LSDLNANSPKGTPPAPRSPLGIVREGGADFKANLVLLLAAWVTGHEVIILAHVVSCIDCLLYAFNKRPSNTNKEKP